MKVYYGELRHFCDDPVCPDPVWKLSNVVAVVFCSFGAPCAPASASMRTLQPDGLDPSRFSAWVWLGILGCTGPAVAVRMWMHSVRWASWPTG